MSSKRAMRDCIFSRSTRYNDSLRRPPLSARSPADPGVQMKTLILVRHAKSSWNDPALRDFDRPLNERGKHDAPLMAKRLVERAVQPQRVLCSPALRTVSTAEVFASQLSIPRSLVHMDRQIYQAGHPQLLQLLCQQDDKFGAIMLIGHNPGLTDLFNSLAGDASIDNLPTCCVAQLTFEVDCWTQLRPA